MYGYFKQQTGEIVHEKTLIWIRKVNFNRETESRLITTQYNTIWTNYMKAKIDDMQQNSKCMLSGERVETVNNINKRSKLAQKRVLYKVQLGEKDDFLGIMQDIKIWPYYQMVYAQTRICYREWNA